MFTEPQTFTSAQALRNHYAQVRKRIYAVPAPKTPPAPQKRTTVWPVAPDRDWKFIEIPESAITIEKIIETVCRYFKVRETELKSHCHYHRVSFPRMIAYYFSRKETKASFPTIARIIGGRDHSTIVSGCSKIEGKLKAGDERTMQAVADIERALAS